MLDCVTFQAQLSSIMGLLSEAAVAEIVKVVEESSSVFRLEMCRSQEENEQLKRKLHLMESELKSARQSVAAAPCRHVNRCSVGVQAGELCMMQKKEEEHCPLIEGVFGMDWCGGLWSGAEPPAVEEKEAALHAGGMKDKSLNIEEAVKEEPEISQPLEAFAISHEVKILKANAEDQGSAGLHSIVESDHQPVVSEVSEKLDDQDSDSDPKYTKGHFLFSKNFETTYNKKAASSEMCTETQFICTPCGRNFENFSQLETHLQNHSDSRLLVATNCGKSLTASRHSEGHQLDHTRGKTFNCAGRGKDFNRSMHKPFHTEVKLYNCNQCGKNFAQKQNLLRHKEIHNESGTPGVTYFTCVECGKNFTSKRYLKAHQFLHTGEKPFNCTVCGKTFSHKCNLYSHLRTHTGEKPFSCNECGKCFCQLGHLKRHRYVHDAKEISLMGCTL